MLLHVFYVAACLNDDTKSRAANLVPYTAPMNSPGRRECTDPAIIIKSAADLNTEQQNEVRSTHRFSKLSNFITKSMA